MQVRDASKQIYFYRSSPKAEMLRPPEPGEVGFKLYASTYFCVTSIIEEPTRENYMRVNTDISVALPQGYYGMITNPMSHHYGLSPTCYVKTEIIDNNYHNELIVTIINAGPFNQYFNAGNLIAQLVLMSSPTLATPLFVTKTLNYTEKYNVPEILVTEVKSFMHLLEPPKEDDDEIF